MNNTDQNHTDNLFKQGLSSPPEFTPSDKDWEEMERLLRPEVNRRSIAWIYTVSGLAAAILIFISLWLAIENTDSVTQQAKAVKGLKNDPGIGNRPKSNLNVVKPGKYEPSTGNEPEIATKNQPSTFTESPISSSSTEKTGLKDAPLASGNLVVADTRGLSVVNSARYLTIQTNYANKFANPRDIEIPISPAPLAKTVVADNEIQDTRTPARAGKWGLSLALSPDVNSVNDMNNSQLGVSMGMGLSYKLGKTLSIGTGIYYSQKLYSADRNSYKVTEKPFATWTSYAKKIDADCRVLDVPLNLSLQISNKTRNKLYASAGMSSYFMLSEKYDFIYNNPSPAVPTGRREYTVRNENKHILNIVNLAVALEKPLSNQVSLVIQPYAKLPLTGIGKGQTDLKSVGVGFALNYGIKKKKL